MKHQYRELFIMNCIGNMKKCPEQIICVSGNLRNTQFWPGTGRVAGLLVASRWRTAGWGPARSALYIICSVPPTQPRWDSLAQSASLARKREGGRDNTKVLTIVEILGPGQVCVGTQVTVSGLSASLAWVRRGNRQYFWGLSKSLKVLPGLCKLLCRLLVWPGQEKRREKAKALKNCQSLSC